MQDKKALAAAALLGAVALVSTRAFASAPAGVWVKVQEVVYAPDATNPTRVQVHGALMLFEGNLNGGQPYPGYTSPAFGYMYYECPTGQAEVCRQEWRDLEANIAKPDTECVGFGVQSLPTGALRQPDSAATNPDVYPIQSGVSPGFSPCQAIAKFMAAQGAGGEGGGGGAPSGGTGSSTGGTGSTTGGTGSSTGGKPASNGGAATAEAGTRSTGEEPTSGSSTGTAGMATGGRPASEPGNLGAGKAATDGTADSKAAGCSITSATGAASVLGLGAALGIFGLALARRHRQRK
jgi:MYXO-CTERM domain-containing protein